MTNARRLAITISVYERLVHEDVVKGWRDNQAVVEAGLREMDEIRASRELSAEGKLARLKEAAAKWTQRLKPLQQVVERGRARVAELEREATAPSSAPKDLIEALLDREIRDQLRGKTSAEISAKYAEAIMAGDTACVRACEHAPASFPMLHSGDHEIARRLKRDMSPRLPELQAAEADVSAHAEVLNAAMSDLQAAIALE
jgi:hypothetical protein